MLVRTTASSAGPNGFVDADKVVDLPDAKAQELIETLHAVPAEPGSRPTARWPHGFDLSAPPRATRK